MRRSWVVALLVLGSAAAAAEPSLVALLVSPEANAARGEAVLEVRVKDAKLEDPGKGVHLHVQLDKEAPIATSDTRVAFHRLSPGPHTIVVSLVGRDEKPLGASDTVWLTVPEQKP